MIADLHIHYPIRLISDPDRDPTLEAMVRHRGRSRIRDRLRAFVLNIADQICSGNALRLLCEYWRPGT